MTTLRAGTLTLVTVLLAERTAWATPSLRWVSLVTLLALSVALLVSAVWVYRTRTRRTRRAIAPLAAVRVLVLGQAAAYAGAGLGGWHLGVLVQLTVGGGFGSPASWNAVALVGGGVVLVAVGYVVQALCKLPPEDSEPTDGDEGGIEGVQGAG